MLTKIKNLMQKPINKMRTAYVGATIGLMSAIAPVVNASTTTKIEGADTTVAALIDIVCTIFRYIGMLLLVWSIGMLVLAFKNEDADSKSRSMMLLVVSCVLMGIKSLVDVVIKK